MPNLIKKSWTVCTIYLCELFSGSYEFKGEIACIFAVHTTHLGTLQRYTYRVFQTIQMKLILLCVWAERAILGSAKTALKFKYET